MVNILIWLVTFGDEIFKNQSLNEWLMENYYKGCKKTTKHWTSTRPKQLLALGWRTQVCWPSVSTVIGKNPSVLTLCQYCHWKEPKCADPLSVLSLERTQVCWPSVSTIIGKNPSVLTLCQYCQWKEPKCADPLSVLSLERTQVCWPSVSTVNGNNPSVLTLCQYCHCKEPKCADPLSVLSMERTQVCWPSVSTVSGKRAEEPKRADPLSVLPVERGLKNQSLLTLCQYCHWKEGWRA